MYELQQDSVVNTTTTVNKIMESDGTWTGYHAEKIVESTGTVYWQVSDCDRYTLVKGGNLDSEQDCYDLIDRIKEEQLAKAA